MVSAGAETKGKNVIFSANREIMNFLMLFFPPKKTQAIDRVLAAR